MFYVCSVGLMCVCHGFWIVFGCSQVVSRLFLAMKRVGAPGRREAPAGVRVEALRGGEDAEREAAAACAGLIS